MTTEPHGHPAEVVPWTSTRAVLTCGRLDRPPVRPERAGRLHARLRRPPASSSRSRSCSLASIIVFALTSAPATRWSRILRGATRRCPRRRIDDERERLHLDEPVVAQYGTWLSLVLHGDFGPSITSHQQHRRRSWAAHGSGHAAAGAASRWSSRWSWPSSPACSAPSSSTRWPTTRSRSSASCSWPCRRSGRRPAQAGRRSTFNEADGDADVLHDRRHGPPTTDRAPGTQIVDIFGHLILPTISLALITYAAWSRFQRSSMLEVLNSDYIRLARAKGLTPAPRPGQARAAHRADPDDHRQRARHRGDHRRRGGHRDRLRVAGHGRYLIDSIATGTGTPCSAWLLVTGVHRRSSFNLIADMLYGVLDPRIRYA